MLFAMLRPGEAKAASVNTESVKLVFGSRSSEIALGDVNAVEAEMGQRWARLRFRHAAGTTTVSGLSRTGARALSYAVETARTEWWCRTLARQMGALRSLCERLAELADPPKYVDADTFGELVQNARAAVGNLVGRWPDSLSDAPEIRMLKDILAFLEAPDDARSKANEVFVANELIRSRALFDRIEARPLTDEQRKAVVIDERRNLVVAAAGSGKTSVIVAKAGWLVRRKYRNPSELLLLAFARDARNEMEERVRKRLGTAIAPGVTVRTASPGSGRNAARRHQLGGGGNRRPRQGRAARAHAAPLRRGGGNRCLYLRWPRRQHAAPFCLHTSSPQAGDVPDNQKDAPQGLREDGDGAAQRRGSVPPHAPFTGRRHAGPGCIT